MRDEDRDRIFWERKAAHYDRVTTGLFGRPLPRVLELTANDVSGSDTVLGVAAGTGLMTAVIGPRVRRVVATDYADNMLAVLRERMKTAGISNVESVHRDIYALGYPPDSFDVVVAGNVLHLVPDLERALDALCHFLRPGGKLIAPTFVHDERRVSRLATREPPGSTSAPPPYGRVAARGSRTARPGQSERDDPGATRRLRGECPLNHGSSLT